MPSPIVVPQHRSHWAVPLSVLAHAGLVASLVLGVAWKSEPPPALQAELWEAMPTKPVPVVAAPEVTPAPALEPKPVRPETLKAPAPEPEAIAAKAIQKAAKKQQVETEPETAKKPVKTQPTLEPKTTPTVEPKSVLKTLPRIEPKPESKLESKPDTSALDAAKNAARANQIARMNQLSQSTGLGGAPTVGAPQAGSAQGLGAGWGAKLKACVQPNLRYSDSSGDNPRVVFIVKLNAAGSPSEPVVNKPSGNAAFDAAVSRALLRCDPFPKPESGGYPASVTVAYRLND